LSDASKYLKPCPACGEQCNQLGARGNLAVCRKCSQKATDSLGNPVYIAEGVETRDGIHMLLGPTAYFAKPNPSADTVCAEVEETGLVYIDGVNYRVYEGVAGWLGFVQLKA
jgi:hypothetical protein